MTRYDGFLLQINDTLLWYVQAVSQWPLDLNI